MLPHAEPRWDIDFMDPRLPSRFWNQVRRGTCWEWTGRRTRGYGQFGWNGRGWFTHRLAYEALVGPIPDGLVLDHLCRNPPCVNPNHLEPVTQGENVRRGYWGTRTHCSNGHEYTPESTYQTTGRRRCAPCQRRWVIESRQRVGRADTRAAA